MLLYNVFGEIYFKLFMYLFRIFKVKNNKIVVSNYFGKGYSDNAKYVCDEMLSQNLDVDIVWLCKNKNDSSIPKKIRIVKYNSIKGLYELATAKIWIDNCRKSYHMIKRRNQIYIQLWHGGIGMKKVEQLAEKSLDHTYIKNAKNDSKMMDYAISNSLYRTKIYKESFWYSGEVLELGCPRNDVFFFYF